MSERQDAASYLDGRLALVLGVRRTLRDLTIFAVAWGVVALIVRTTLVRPPLGPWWGALAIPIVAGVAWVRGARMRPSRAALVALIDARSRSGGLLMAAEVADIGEWRRSVAAVEAPDVRFEAKRPLRYAACAGAFALAALLVPQREAAASRHVLEIGPDVDRAEGRLRVAEEEKILPPERSEAMKQTLEELRREAAGDDPGKALEMLDTMTEAISRAAGEASESALRKTEALTRVEALAGALDSNETEKASLADGMRALADQAKGSDIVSSLPEELQKAVARKSFSSDELRKLGGAARAGKESLRRSLDRLRSAGLIDPKTLSRRDRLADAGDRARLARYLRDQARKKGWSSAIGEYVPGSGGVDRGPGAAPMFFGEKSGEKGTGWKDQELASAAAAMENSHVTAVSAAAPDPAHPERSSVGALAGAKGGAGSAFTPVVLPRHRGTVKRFFERK
jgi:hypothetical protein